MESSELRALKAAAYEVQTAPALNKIAAAERLAGALVVFCQEIDKRVRALEANFTCR